MLLQRPLRPGDFVTYRVIGRGKVSVSGQERVLREYGYTDKNIGVLRLAAGKERVTCSSSVWHRKFENRHFSL